MRYRWGADGCASPGGLLRPAYAAACSSVASPGGKPLGGSRAVTTSTVPTTTTVSTTTTTVVLHPTPAPPLPTTTTVASGSTQRTPGPGTPVLGSATHNIYAHAGHGFGQVRPATVFLGGDPTGMLDQITWSAWGGAEATGTGTSYWVGPGQMPRRRQQPPASWPSGPAPAPVGTCTRRWSGISPGHRNVQPGHRDRASGRWRSSGPRADRVPFSIRQHQLRDGLWAAGDDGRGVLPDRDAVAVGDHVAADGTFLACQGQTCMAHPAPTCRSCPPCRSVFLGPFTCSSATDGMTCLAGDRGFRISKTGIVPAAG